MGGHAMPPNRSGAMPLRSVMALGVCLAGLAGPGLAAADSGGLAQAKRN